MSKALEGKIDELFEATKDLMSREEIEPICNEFKAWVEENTSYSIKSLGTLYSRYGFYKKFKSIPLEQGRNAESIAKHDAEGNITGYELKHYVVLLCGLNEQQWLLRNESTRVIERLGNDREIDPDKYLEVTGKLLESENSNELAVGIIASTGRRPHEILARAKFIPLTDEPYHVLFSGQGKKRGLQPMFKIATLYPADYIIKCLSKLRHQRSIKQLLEEVTNQFPLDEVRQNEAIDNRRGQSLRRVVQDYFGGKDDPDPVLPFRHGESQDNNKALRAAYGAIAVERDCTKSAGARMLYYAQLLGHFVKEKPTDRELQAIATSMGYADYYCSKPVGFPVVPTPQEQNSHTVTENEPNPQRMGQKADEKWGDNQQAIIGQVINSQQQQTTAVELAQAKSLVSELSAKIQQLEAKNEHLEAKNKHLETEKENLQVATQNFQERINNLGIETEQLLTQIQHLKQTNQELFTQNEQLVAETKELLETQNQLEEANKQLQTQLEKTNMDQTKEKLFDLICSIVDEKLRSVIAEPEMKVVDGYQLKPTQATQPTRIPKTYPKPDLLPVAPVVSWEDKSNKELWATRAPGAAQEKMRRGLEAIKLYNNTVATGDNDRIAITNVGLRELTGVNGQVVGSFLKAHRDEVVEHHIKYGMQPIDKLTGDYARDNEGNYRLDSYYNKRHGEAKIKEILLKINQTFLEGEAAIE